MYAIFKEKKQEINVIFSSGSARHWSRDICMPVSQIVQKNFIKIRFIKECPEEILMKLAIVPDEIYIKLEIVLKISKSS
jgi:hypothetical protein